MASYEYCHKWAVTNISKIQSEPSVLCEFGVAKAIHNTTRDTIDIPIAVTNISKIQSEPSVFPIKSIGTSFASSLKAIYDEWGSLNNLTLRCYRLIAKCDTIIAKYDNLHYNLIRK
ncbi:MAG: hypothetical protein HOO91_17565 [Bacteroidales bacterium]|nr:hypothetical protein [Bacteroidales bacterium]